MIRVNHPAYVKKQAEMAEKVRKENEQRAIEAERTRSASSNAMPAITPQYMPSLREIASRREFEEPIRRQEEARQAELRRRESERQRAEALRAERKRLRDEQDAKALKAWNE